MFHYDHPVEMPSADRFREIAAILASAFLRLQKRTALPGKKDSEIMPEISPDGLEVSEKTRLSVRVG